MGIFSQLTSVLGLGKKQVNILVVGLDNSGKSTILNYMKPSEVQSTHVRFRNILIFGSIHFFSICSNYVHFI